MTLLNILSDAEVSDIIDFIVKVNVKTNIETTTIEIKHPTYTISLLYNCYLKDDISIPKSENPSDLDLVNKTWSINLDLIEFDSRINTGCIGFNNYNQCEVVIQGDNPTLFMFDTMKSKEYFKLKEVYEQIIKEHESNGIFNPDDSEMQFYQNELNKLEGYFDKQIGEKIEEVKKSQIKQP